MTGLRQLEHPCWTVVTPSGEGAGFEGGFVHYESEAAALAAITGGSYGNDPAAVLAAREETWQCWTGESRCGAGFEASDDDASTHFPSEADIRREMRHDGWREAADGSWACYDGRCPTCTVPVDDDQPPEPLPGQLPLPYLDPVGGLVLNPGAVYALRCQHCEQNIRAVDGGYADQAGGLHCFTDTPDLPHKPLPIVTGGRA